MRVLFAYPFCGLGGVETALVTRAAALRAIGWEAEVVFEKLYGDGGASLLDEPQVSLADRADIVQRLAGGTYDAVVAVDHPALVDRLEKTASTVPVLFETHTAHLAAARQFYTGIERDVVRAVIVPAPFNRDRVLEETGTEKPVFVVPNPVDLDRFTPSADASLPGVPEGRRVILWVGRLEDEKNPAEAIEIVRALAGDAVLLMIGDAPHDPEYPARIAHLASDDLRDRVLFRRALPYADMPAAFALAASTGGCLLSTSVAEASPMTFIEAMAAGCPIVSSAIGELPARLADGRGWTYPLGDVAAGAAAVSAAFDPRARAAAADAGRAFVAAEHDQRRSAQILARTIRRTVTGGPRPALDALAVVRDPVVGGAVDHLRAQGLEAYVVSSEPGPAGDVVGLERVDAEHLDAAAAAAAGRDVTDWFVVQRGDELAYAPFPDMSLLGALSYVDALGYDEVEFRIYGMRAAKAGWNAGVDVTVAFPFVERDAAPVYESRAFRREMRRARRRLFPIAFPCCRFDALDRIADRDRLARFGLERERIAVMTSNRAVRLGEARNADIARIVRQMQRTLDGRGDLVARALAVIEDQSGP